MPNNQHFHKSIRLVEYDYSQAGAYFFTIVSYKRQEIFGKLSNGQTILSPLGDLIFSVWRGLSEKFPQVATDEFVVMPDHLHGIIFLQEELPRIPEGKSENIPKLGTVIGTFKSSVTRLYRAINKDFHYPIWQRNYYERIIRNEKELERFQAYIESNPIRGEFDGKPPLWM
jgi:REP element-mobilizing transposase RayT